MAKASPARRNFNAGEFSILVEGRTDLDKYGASMRRMLNGIAAPQGPFIGRSGTMHVAETRDQNKYSTLIPFIFNDTEALNLEFNDRALSFVFESGKQTFAPEDVNAVSGTAPTLTLSSPGLVAAGNGLGVGSRVALSGFDNSYNVNTRVAKVIAVGGPNITLDLPGTGFVVGPITGVVSLLYEIGTPYSDVDARNIRALQDQDVVYLFCKGYQPRVLSRRGAYNWTLTLKAFNNGPFMPEDSSGGLNSISFTTTGAPGIYDAGGGTDPLNAFDGNKATYWESGQPQIGTIQWQYPTPIALNGYVIYPAYGNTDTTYAATDFAPGAWTFEGSNDNFATAVVLDTQKDYVLYEDGRSAWFKINNTAAYSYYRLAVTQATRNGTNTIRIAEILCSTLIPPALNVTINGATTLNGGTGFAATDVGRLIRAKSSDNLYRILQITSVTNGLNATASLLSEPFFDTTRVFNWSVGYFSDTTGWPSFGTFFEDRLWVAGVAATPGLVVGSRTGLYDDFQQKTSSDEVLDDSAIAAVIKSRKVSDIRWLETDERGLLLGTGTGEFVISASNTDNALTARNIKARASTARGSAFIEPVKVDRQILHIHVSRRTMREYTYSFQSDGYVSRSLSLFASHLGIPRFAQMVYAAEPHSIVWVRRDDGSVVGLTYNKDEDVIGWHQHNFSGVVESLSVIPSAVDIQDSLWMVVRRTINGRTCRYIERLVRFWDFDSSVEQAHYVDSGLRYDGPPTNTLYNLWHMEGQTLQGLLNGIPYDGLVVSQGKITLPIEDVTSAVVGLPYVQEGEISNIEAGAADGTAQGKVKRIHNVAPHVWDTYYGEVGVWDEENQKYEFNDIEYRELFDELTPVVLQTEVLKPINMPPGYGNRGSVVIRQTKPLPLNIIALYPQLNTQDR